MRHFRNSHSVLSLKAMWLFCVICILTIPTLSFAELKEEWHIHYTSDADILDFEVDAQGNIYLVGFDREPVRCTDWFVISFDASGEYRWKDTYDGPDDPAVDSLSDSHTDDAMEVEIGPNGMVYVAGRSSMYIPAGEYNADLYGFPKIIGYSSLGSRIFEAFPEGEPDGNLMIPYCNCTDMHVDNNGFAHFGWSGLAISTPGGDVTFLRAGNDTDELSFSGGGMWASKLDVDGAGNNYIVGRDVTDDGTFAGVLKLAPFGGVVWKTLTDIGDGSGYMAVDQIGHVYVVTSIGCCSGRLISKFGLGGGIEYSIPVPGDQKVLQMECDDAGHLIVNVLTHLYVYSTETLALLWDIPNAYFFQLGPEGDIYVSGINGETARRFKPDGTMLWEASEITLFNGDNIYQSRFRVAENGCIYQVGFGGSEIWVEKLSQPKIFTIRDINNDTIPHVEFTLMKVENNPPDYTDDTLGTFRTDSLGNFFCDYLGVDSFLFVTDEYDIEPDTIVIGDTLKFTRHITDSAAVKHSGVLETMYNIHLDNIRFDENGALVFDTVTGARQDIFMDHTEIRYNLLASVEWDASASYLSGLQENFRGMSNYLYDVTDGQVRLDTVMIFDNSDHWFEADYWIYASNMEWPRTIVDGIHELYDQVDNLGMVKMPRLFTLDARNDTYFEHPLNMVDPVDFRTKVHELGHYAFGFYDEYLLWDATAGDYVDDASLRCGDVSNYGFMQDSDPGDNPYRTEMSSGHFYEKESCQNTEQYMRLNSSCWEYFEVAFEGLYETDTFFVPIIKPNDSARASYPGSMYLEGPNNNLTSPLTMDYDVGSKIVFTNYPSSPAIGIKNVDVEISQGFTAVPNAEVYLFKLNDVLSWLSTNQGNTADNGRIIVLGAKAGDEIRSVGTRQNVTKSSFAAHEEWLYGSALVDGDSLSVDLTPVDGFFPLICDVVLNDGSATFSLTNETDFPSMPSMTYRPSDGGEYAYDFSSTTDGYDVYIGEYPGLYGTATVEAEDNSADTFFFINDYTFAEFAPTATKKEFYGPSGGSQILFYEDNPTLGQAMFLSSPFTIIRTGLTEANIQGGNTHTLSVYPNDAMTGSGLMRIRYFDADIISRGGTPEDEASLRIFRWVDKVVGWTEVGGTVDTVLNQVVKTITEPGVYAVFTTDASVDVEDDEYGDNLPYRFELSQNYPNPFNPITTIKYNLPRRTHVIIDIYNVLGQKVRTLVDREESAGSYSIIWDGDTDSGQPVATGVYLYRFQAGDHVETKKMLLLK